MELTYPAGLLGLFLAIPIVALQLKQPREQRVSVSTLMFWDRLLPRDEASSTRGRAWRTELVLQLATLFALVVALVRPTFHANDELSAPTASSVGPTAEEGLAMKRFAVRRGLLDPDSVDVLATIQNRSDQSQVRQVDLYLDDRLKDVTQLEFPPQETTSYQRRVRTRTGGQLSLQVEGTRVDAQVRLPGIAVPTVALVGVPNAALERAIQATGEVKLVRWEQIPSTLPEGALVVCHRLVPATWPQRNLLIIDPPPGSALIETGDPLMDAVAATQVGESQLLESIDFTGIDLAGARTLQLPETLQPLVLNASRHPLLAASTGAGPWTVVVTADLSASELVRQATFPMFIRNVIATHTFGGNWNQRLGQLRMARIADDETVHLGSLAGSGFTNDSHAPEPFPYWQLAGVLGLCGLLVEWGYVLRQGALRRQG